MNSKIREELRKPQFLNDEQLKIPVLPVKFLECKLQPSLSTNKLENNNTKSKIIQNGMVFPFSIDSTVKYTPIEAVKVMTAGDDVKRVLNISVNTEGMQYDCVPGDTVGIVPQNAMEEVEELLSCLGLLQHANDTYTINVLSETKKKNAAVPQYLPTVFVLKDVFKTCVDIRAIPKKAFLRVLCEYTSSDERRRLEELCSQQGSEAYTRLILNNSIGVLDILQSFPSCVPPIERLLEHLPRLQARPYSISLQEINRIHFAVTVVEDGPGGRRGVCSGWLDDIASKLIERGELHHQMEKMTLDADTQLKVPLYLRCRSLFTVPKDPTVPIIMIGPGTGVAPFIGFLQYRSAQKKAANEIKLGFSWLFFGCRYESRDYLFRSEIEDFLSKGILDKLSVSFSRDKTEENNHPHIKYVQDSIKKEKQCFVSQILENNAVVFLCGDAKNMVKDVQQTIIQCIQEVKGISETEAKEVFSKLQKDQRYLQDIWL